jgi:hypothetical protein
MLRLAVVECERAQVQRLRREGSWHILWYYPDINLESLRIITKISVKIANFLAEIRIRYLLNTVETFTTVLTFSAKILDAPHLIKLTNLNMRLLEHEP